MGWGVRRVGRRSRRNELGIQVWLPLSCFYFNGRCNLCHVKWAEACQLQSLSSLVFFPSSALLNEFTQGILSQAKERTQNADGIQASQIFFWVLRTKTKRKILLTKGLYETKPRLFSSIIIKKEIARRGPATSHVSESAEAKGTVGVSVDAGVSAWGTRGKSTPSNFGDKNLSWTSQHTQKSGGKACQSMIHFYHRTYEQTNKNAS